MNGAQYENQQGTGPNPEAQHTNPQYQSGPRTGIPPEFQAHGQPGRHKSPVLASILSCMPGLGQVYVGYYQQGFINMLVVASTIAALSSGSIRGMEPFFGVFLAFFWIFNMIDASRRATHYNRVQDGLGGEEIPDDFKLPKAGGSMFGGVVLVVIGVLFILDLNFDVSLSWIKDWWPLMLIAFGGNLIYKARQKAG